MAKLVGLTMVFVGFALVFSSLSLVASAESLTAGLAAFSGVVTFLLGYRLLRAASSRP